MKKTIRRILLVSGCLFAIVCLAAQTPDANKAAARDSLNSGVAAFKNGQPQLAVESRYPGAGTRPGPYGRRLYLGVTYASMATSQNTEMTRKAIQSFERVLQRQADNQEAASRLATLHLSTGQAEKARILFTQLTKTAPLRTPCILCAWSVGLDDREEQDESAARSGSEVPYRRRAAKHRCRAAPSTHNMQTPWCIETSFCGRKRKPSRTPRNGQNW